MSSSTTMMLLTSTLVLLPNQAMTPKTTSRPTEAMVGVTPRFGKSWMK